MIFDPPQQQRAVDVAITIVPSGMPLPADADLILLLGPNPAIHVGSGLMVRSQVDIDILPIIDARRKVLVSAVCYQMLGRRNIDPIESARPGRRCAGRSGLIDIETVLAPHRKPWRKRRLRK